MSQASKALKKIAACEEYKALAAAVEAKDYETIARSFARVCELLEEEKKQVREKILTLPRQNKDEDREQFETAVTLRAGSTLPQWHSISQMIKEQGIMEGEVFGAGSRGDPLVRTAQGRIVVIAGATLEKGAKVRFKVVTEGQKLDFGRVVEFNAEYFSYLLNREARDCVKKSFDAVEECLRSGPVATDEAGLARLSELLKGLEQARELTGKLEVAEREGTAARIVNYRRRLLADCGTKLALDLMVMEEEREIAETCGGNEQQTAVALSSPGLFRPLAHHALKGGLFSGQEIRGYSETLRNLEGKVDSMNAALKLMEFQSSVEKLLPSARAYLEAIDRLLERLNRKARQLGTTLAEGRIATAEEINSAVRGAFSGAALGLEVRRTFRSAEEFFTLRGALNDLRTMLGDSQCGPAEAALKPYLSRRIAAAFGADVQWGTKAESKARATQDATVSSP